MKAKSSAPAIGAVLASTFSRPTVSGRAWTAILVWSTALISAG
jgi:hypothetical protein